MNTPMNLKILIDQKIFSLISEETFHTLSLNEIISYLIPNFKLWYHYIQIVVIKFGKIFGVGCNSLCKV